MPKKKKKSKIKKKPSKKKRRVTKKNKKSKKKHSKKRKVTKRRKKIEKRFKDTNIQKTLSAEPLFKTKQEWIKNSLANKSQYQNKYNESIKNNNAFWKKEGKRITWIKPYKKLKM